MTVVIWDRIIALKVGGWWMMYKGMIRWRCGDAGEFNNLNHSLSISSFGIDMIEYWNWHPFTIDYTIYLSKRC